jgi:hypothetical protein
MGVYMAKRKGRQTASPKVDWKALEVVQPAAAGIDIGGKEHWVAISPERDERCTQECVRHGSGQYIPSVGR